MAVTKPDPRRQGQSIFGSGGALSRNTRSIEPEKSKRNPPPTPIFLLGENVTHGGCDVRGARYLAQGVARELRRDETEPTAVGSVSSRRDRVDETRAAVETSLYTWLRATSHQYTRTV